MTDLTTRAAAEWGAEAQMSPLESLMWRTELNPRLRSTGMLLEVLDGPPERERLITAHEWATRLLTRLRKRVVEDPLGLAAPRWVIDRDFDLAYHLRFIRLPEPGSMQQVLDLAQVMAMAPFERARPLWEAMLVEGLADGRAAYVLKLHHSLADGMGFVQMLDILHSDRAEPGRHSDLPAPAPEWVSGVGVSAGNLLGLSRRAAHEVLRAGGRVTSLADRIVSRPQSVAGACATSSRSPRCSVRRPRQARRCSSSAASGGASGSSTCRSPRCAAAARRRGGRSTTRSSPGSPAACGATTPSTASTSTS